VKIEVVSEFARIEWSPCPDARWTTPPSTMKPAFEYWKRVPGSNVSGLSTKSGR